MKIQSYSINKFGFTLIELMIAIAVLAILASMLISKMGNVYRKANEGKTKANLSALRGAINVYYGDNDGLYPNPTSENNLYNLNEVLTMHGGKYISHMPNCYCSLYHDEVNTCIDLGYANLNSLHNNDGGQWAYYGGLYGDHLLKGQAWVNCNHNDIKNKKWYKN